MNKRQYKKRRLYFMSLNDYPYEPFGETQCPYCGFDYLNYTVDELNDMGGSCRCIDMHSFFDGDYSGMCWTDVVKCPTCKKTFYCDDSNI